MACDCLPGRVQAAFKRAPATSLSSTATTGPDAPGLDWEKVKPEDQTLVHQVSTSVTATASVYTWVPPHTSNMYLVCLLGLWMVSSFVPVADCQMTDGVGA